MHYHLTNPQLLASGFALLLAIIFAVAAVLESRIERPSPFRSFFCAGLDRNLFANASFTETRERRADQITVFPDIDAAYLDSLEFQAKSRNASPDNLE
jgi:hypothetical protein